MVVMYKDTEGWFAAVINIVHKPRGSAVAANMWELQSQFPIMRDRHLCDRGTRQKHEQRKTYGLGCYPHGWSESCCSSNRRRLSATRFPSTAALFFGSSCST